MYIYVQRKVRIGTIPELYLRKVRIPTLSADSWIVPDNSRIAQGVRYWFLVGSPLEQSRKWLDKVRMAFVKKACFAHWQRKNDLTNVLSLRMKVTFEPRHEISNNVVCATSKVSDQPAHTCSLIRAFVCRLNILWLLSYWLNTIWSF